MVPTASFALDPRLRRSARIRALPTGPSGRIATLELVALLGAGVVASLLTNVMRLRLGIPGSNIVFVAFPLALGFALVPRRGAGLLMTGGAVAANAVLWLAGVRLDGLGAQTSLLATGPLLDLALRRFGGGWALYGAFLAACATSNALAFAVRGIARAAGMRGTGMGGGRSFAAWWPEAVWTYALAGVVAGLISAAAWFHLREPTQ
jgi:hypothetical protein